VLRNETGRFPAVTSIRAVAGTESAPVGIIQKGEIVKAKWILFLSPVIVFAGAGANGGSGTNGFVVNFNLLYGTFAVTDGTNFDYVATNIPLIEDDNGNQLLSEIAMTPGLDPRIYTGVAQILGSGATAPSTVTLTLDNCEPTPCSVSPGPVTFTNLSQPIDNLAFSGGVLANVADPTNSSQIAAAAVLANLLNSANPGSSTPGATLTLGTVTVTSGIPNPTTDVTTYGVELLEQDFTGTANVTTAPEPAAFLPMVSSLAGLLWSRRRFGRV
jgi:hypothetical protein